MGTQQSRPVWSGRVTFILAAVGSAIGLGNLWRFPYIAYQNGGGAFLIPYLVALFLAGIPLLIMELGLGQMTRSGAITTWRGLSRHWEWVGWYALFSSLMIVLYYAVVMAWCFVFLWASLKAVYFAILGQATALPWAGAEKAYFFKQVLQVNKPGQFGSLVWPLVGGLALTWLSIWLCIRRGVHSVGKVVWVTVLLPVALLLILIVRGVTLPGASEGLYHFLHPNFSKLKEFDVWRNAFGQIFFSLSVGFGIMIAYASHRPKDAEITNTAIMTALLNCTFSFLGGFAVFSAIGYLAHVKGVPVKDVASVGPGLAFVTFPAILAKLPGPMLVKALFSTGFFLMLLMLGIDSAFSIVEGIAVAIHDRIAGRIKRETLTWLLCLLGFLGGLFYCLNSGLYWLDIVDHFINNMGLLFVGFLQVFVLAWVVGTERLKVFVSRVSELPIGKLWEHMIAWDMPRLLGVMMLIAIYTDIAVPYENYPRWMLHTFGWGMIGFGICASIALSYLITIKPQAQDQAELLPLSPIVHHAVNYNVFWRILRDIIVLALYTTFVSVSWFFLFKLLGARFSASAFLMYMIYTSLIFGGVGISFHIALMKDNIAKRIDAVSLRHPIVDGDELASWQALQHKSQTLQWTEQDGQVQPHITTQDESEREAKKEDDETESSS